MRGRKTAYVYAKLQRAGCSLNLKSIIPTDLALTKQPLEGNFPELCYSIMLKAHQDGVACDQQSVLWPTLLDNKESVCLPGSVASLVSMSQHIAPVPIELCLADAAALLAHFAR